MTLDARLRDVRRVQLGAAIGATGIVGAALEPFQASFPGQLTELAVLSSGGDLDWLGVETVIAQDALGEWIDLLRDAYGLSAENAVIAESVAPGAAHLVVGVAEGRATSVPRVWIGVQGSLPSVRVDEILRRSGVGADARAAWDTLLGRLRLRDVSRVDVSFATPTAAPQAKTTLIHRFDPGSREDLVGRLDLAMQALGVSDGQRRWHGATVQAFGGSGVVELVTTLERGRLVHRLDVGWPRATIARALQVMRQFSRAADLPTRLGALTALVDGDHVDRLDLTGWDREPPAAGVELFLRRPDPAKILG